MPIVTSKELSQAIMQIKRDRNCLASEALNHLRALCGIKSNLLNNARDYILSEKSAYIIKTVGGQHGRTMLKAIEANHKK